MSDSEADRVFLAEAIAKGPEGADAFFANLDAENDELGVRARLAEGRYNTRRSELAEEWLKRREETRRSEVDARVEAREEETLAVAREANEIARSASFAATAAAAAASEANKIARSNRRVAIAAAIIAVAAAIAQIIWR